MATFLGAVARLPSSGPAALRNARNGHLVAGLVRATPDSAARRKGLLGEASMPEGSALVIAPTCAIHTFFMRFAIDVAFVTRTGRVLKVVRDLRPWRIAVALRAAAAVELPAGTLARALVERGDVLHIEPLAQSSVESRT